MRMRTWLVVGLTMGCNGGGSSTPDGRVADGSSVDGPIDALVDSTRVDAFVDDCPNRTAPVGEPRPPITTAETHSGDVTIASTLDIQLLAGIRFVNGNLTIDSTTLSEVVLPDLEAVRGHVLIPTSTTVLRVELPRLETVGGAFQDQSSSMKNLRAPQLETFGRELSAKLDEIDVHCLRGIVGTPDTWNVTLGELTQASLHLPKLERGNLRISNNPALTDLQLPSLTTGSVHVGRSADVRGTNMPNLTAIDLPALATGGELVADDLPALTSITLGAGAAIEHVSLMSLPQLPSLAWLAQTTYRGLEVSGLDLVTSISGTFASGTTSAGLRGNARLTDIRPVRAIAAAQMIQIIGNPLLTTIELPNLRTVQTTFQVAANSQLTTLSAPRFDRIIDSEDIDSEIRSNLMLPNCQATEIRDRVLPNSQPARFVVTNNKPDSCQ